MLEFVRKKDRNWSANQLQKINSRPCYLHCSQIDPQKEVDNILKRIDFNKHLLLIIFGLENTSLINECANKMSANSKMFLVEITDSNGRFTINGDKNFVSMLQDPRIHFMGGRLEDIIIDFSRVLLDRNSVYNIKNLTIVSHPYQKSKYELELRRTINHMIESLNTTISSYGNSTEDVLIGIDNFFNNWNHYNEGLHVDHFKDRYSGKTAIIVGAGPSLDECIEELKKVQGKALILAVDAALESLLEHGIVPDMVSTLERLEVTLKFYKNIQKRDDIVFGCPNLISGKVLDKFSKKIFTGRRGDSFFVALGEKLERSNLEVGMNVAHVPTSVALFMGCSRIVFVGLDLAYTGGKTHFSGVTKIIDESTKRIYTENTCKVEGQNGEILDTFEYFLYSKVWLEKMIPNTKTEFFNASIGGAKIIGTKEITLNDFINDHLVNEKIVSLKDVFENVDKYPIQEKRLDMQAYELLDETIDIISEMELRLKQMIKSVNKNKISMKTISKNRRELESYIDNNPFIRTLLQPLFLAYNYKLAELPVNILSDDLNNFGDDTRDYYSTLVGVLIKIKESVSIYKEIIETHMSRTDI